MALVSMVRRLGALHQRGGSGGGGGGHSMVLAHTGAGGEAQLAALLAAWLAWFGGLRVGDALQARLLLCLS